MGVFASSTDVKDIKERAELSGFNAAIILNKKGEMYGHIADYDLGIYVKDVDIYIRYQYPEGEYESELLAAIKRATSLEDVHTLMKYSEWDYFEDNYPLSDSDKAQLDGYVATRFENVKTYGAGYANSKYPKKGTSVKKIENWLDDSTDTVDYEEVDVYGVGSYYKTDAEFAAMTDLEKDRYVTDCPMTALTDFQWTWFESNWSNYETSK